MLSGTTFKTTKLLLAPFFLLFVCTDLFSQKLNVTEAQAKTYRPGKSTAAAMLAERLKCFDQQHDHSIYSIALCGDVPDNTRPQKVFFKKEPGHVFLVLTMQDSVCRSEAVNMVFGFYPSRPASSLLFKNIRCEIIDNSQRDYDVRIEKNISSFVFRSVLDNAVTLARKKYNLNQYNCYNYAIDVFNSLPGIEKIPVSSTRFPFIAGKGGSPCCLYRDLEKLKQERSVWASNIHFGSFKAPVSCKN